MSMTFLALFAAAIPEVPATNVQAIREGDVWVMRNLIDDNHLYTFDKDEVASADRPARSNCVDACAQAYRPLTAAGSDKPVGRWTLVQRDDGADQWVFDGHPVYSFAADPEPTASRDGSTGAFHRLPTIPAD
jgi:predicted lipoprotein with Yx(FWY)xxD motif